MRETPARFASLLVSLLLLCRLLLKPRCAAGNPARRTSGDSHRLRAMRTELDRSTSRLKMENVAAPYYIEYRVFDLDEYHPRLRSAPCVP